MTMSNRKWFGTALGVRSQEASLVSTAYCALGVLALSAGSLFSERAVAGCDLTTHFAKLNSAGPSVPGALPSAPSVSADWSGRESRAITGYWLIVDSDSQSNVTDERFDNFFVDHNEVFMDQSPPPTGNACNGTWVQSGPGEFKELHKAWVFDSTNTIAIGTFVLRSLINLSENKDSLSGTETGTVYDLNGNVLATFGPFDIKGTRIRVDF